MNDVLRVAIIGCGGFAGAHVRRLRAIEGVRIVGLFSRTEATIDSLVSRRLDDYEHPFGRYTNLLTLFSSEKPDLAIIVTPHDVHTDHALAALESGAHVLLEKPMVPTVREATQLVTRAEEHGLALAVAFNPPSTEPHRRLRSLLATGALGTIGVVSGAIGQDWRRPTAASWRQDAQRSHGGQLADSGSHLVSAVVGALPGLPTTVSAHVASRGTSVPVDAAIQLTYDDGPLVSLAIAGDSAVATSHLSFIGTRGRVDIDGWNGQWLRGASDDPESGLASEVVESSAEPNPTAAMVAHLWHGTELDCDGRTGLRITAVIEAALRSAKEGRPVATRELVNG